MSDRYPIPARRHRAEIEVRRSRFIAIADHAPTVEAAQAFLAEMRAEFSDATHHVHAFCVGHGASLIQGMSDDGEPGGTAGRPSMAVLSGSGLGDVALVTVRYYGGSKLGTGGLVRAYTEAAQAVLAELPRAIRETRQRVAAQLPYPLFEQARRAFLARGAVIESEDFEIQVRIRAHLALDQVEPLAEDLAELSAGGVELELGEMVDVRGAVED